MLTQLNGNRAQQDSSEQGPGQARGSGVAGLPAWSGWRIRALQPGFDKPGPLPAWSVSSGVSSGLWVVAGVPESLPPGWQVVLGKARFPAEMAGGGGVVGGQTQRPRHTPAHCCLLLPFQSPLSPLLPKALAWVPLEPSVCSFTSNPPEVGGPAARELRALGESRPRNAEPQPPRMPPSGRLPGTAMPPGSLCLFLAAGANTSAETLNPRSAESKGQF